MPQSRVVDVDLLPGALPARRSAWQDFLAGEPQWIGVAACLALLLVLAPARAQITEQKVEAQERLELAQRRAAVNLPREVRELRAKLEVARKEAEGLPVVQTQINRLQRPWNQVVELARGSAPSGIRLRSASLEGDGKTLLFGGDAPGQNAVLAYVDTLRNSGTFATAEVRSLVQAGTAGPRPIGSQPFSYTIGATLAEPAPGSGGGRAAAAFFGRDYLLASRVRTTREGEGQRHRIRGTVVDRQGKPVEGLTFRASTCCPEWSAYYPGPFDPASPGSFEFLVTDGKFVVEVVDPRGVLGDRATELDTMAAGPGRYFEWNLAFLRTSDEPLPSGGR